MRSYFIGVFLFLFFSCKSQLPTESKGLLVEVKSEIYTGGPTPPFATSSLIWYRDSFAIEEIKLIKFDTDSKGVQTRNDVMMRYTFIDLRSHTLYDYSSFSDTAKLIKKYSQPDSMYVDGGTNFYYTGKKIRETPEVLLDTIIGKEVYKRIKFTLVEHDPKNIYTIGYLRCNKPSVFSFEKKYSDSLGCSMIKLEAFNKKTNEMLMSTEFNFIRDTLIFEENKIFDIWEKQTK